MASAQVARVVIPKVINSSVIFFPGQGSQYVGMVQNLNTKGKGLFNVASQVLGYDLLNLCQHGPEEDLNKTVHSQPAVFVSSLAAVEQLAERCPQAIEKCIATAGFSVGEFAALVFAKSLDFVDALRLIKIRAEVTQSICESIPSGMMTILHAKNANVEQAVELAREYCIRSGISKEESICSISNYLFLTGKVVGGHQKALEFIEHNYKDFGITRTKRLAVSGAFHTQIMKSAKEDLELVLSKMKINMPEMRVYSNVDAKIYGNIDEIKLKLVKHVWAPVMWQQIINNIYVKHKADSGEYPVTFECGPQNNLTTMLGMTFKHAKANSFNIEP